MCSITALSSAEDAGTDAVFWRCAGICGDCENGTGEFGARYPGEGRLVLVFASDLEEVEEVGCGGVDGN